MDVGEGEMGKIVMGMNVKKVRGTAS